MASPEARREPKIRRTIIAGAAVAALTLIPTMALAADYPPVTWVGDDRVSSATEKADRQSVLLRGGWSYPHHYTDADMRSTGRKIMRRAPYWKALMRNAIQAQPTPHVECMALASFYRNRWTAGHVNYARALIHADRPAARRAQVRLRADRALARDLSRPCFFAGLE